MENFNFLFDDDDEDWDDDDWGDEDIDIFEQLIGEAQDQKINDLYYALSGQPVKQLRAIASRRGWTLKGTLKDDIVEQMAEYMFTAVEQPDFLSGLTAEEHELLAIIHTLFNFNNTLWLTQIQHIWSNALRYKKSVRPILSGLENYGLFYECGEHGADLHYHPYVTIPLQLLPVYPVFPTQNTKVTQHKPLPSAPNFLQQFEQFGSQLAAGHNVELCADDGEIHIEGHEQMAVGNWPYLPEEVARLPKFSAYYLGYQNYNFYLTVPLLKELLEPAKNKVLITGIGDATKADWFISLAMQLQLLLMADPEKPNQVYFNPEPWSMLLSLSSQERLQFLFHAWQNSILDLSELRQLLVQNKKISVIRQPHPEIPYQVFLFDNMLAKQTVMRLLQGIAEDEKRSDEWHSFEQLLEDFFLYQPNVFHSLSPDKEWTFKEGHRVLAVENRRDWFATYGKMLQSLFTGALYWLNVVDLQVKGKDAHAFRLTATGKALLSPQFGLAHLDETTSPGEVIWLNGRTAKVSPGYEVNAFLGLITHLGTAVPDQPFTYTLAPEQIEHAFLAGESPDTLNRLFLESGWRLPDEGYGYMEELYGRFGKTHIYEDLTLIEFSDDHALRELQAAGILKGALIYEFSPRIIAVKPEMLDTISKRLEKQNYTPRMMQG